MSEKSVLTYSCSLLPGAKQYTNTQTVYSENTSCNSCNRSPEGIACQTLCFYACLHPDSPFRAPDPTFDTKNVPSRTKSLISGCKKTRRGKKRVLFDQRNVLPNEVREDEEDGDKKRYTQAGNDRDTQISSGRLQKKGDDDLEMAITQTQQS